MELQLTNKEKYNPQKLCGEIAKTASDCTILDTPSAYIVEWEGAAEEQVLEIIKNHDPTPEPTPLTDIEQTQLAIAEAIEKQETDKVEQQLAQAEMFETILQMLEPQGGGE